MMMVVVVRWLCGRVPDLCKGQESNTCAFAAPPWRTLNWWTLKLLVDLEVILLRPL